MKKEQFMALVLEHQQGNKEAQRKLYIFLSKKAESVFAKKGFSKQIQWEDAEQTVLDKILFIFNYRFSTGEQSNPLGFIYRVFLNGFIDLQRKLKQRNECRFTSFSGEEDDYPSDAALDYTTSAEPADQHILKRDLLSAVVKGIAELGSMQRQVLQLLLIEQLAPAEVMRIMNISRSKLDTTKHLGLKNLRKRLQKLGYQLC